MVRLKERTAPRPYVRTIISIPYGSIKSVVAVLDVAELVQFQFLMVRLKVDTAVMVAALSSDFNSLWFD